MFSQVTFKIESRVHLLSTLAEAAELEHDLICMDLYAALSFKRTTAEGLTVEEIEAVNGWRKALLNICVEEMTHRALVANLTTAVGGGAHFFRPEFPSSRANGRRPTGAGSSPCARGQPRTESK